MTWQILAQQTADGWTASIMVEEQPQFTREGKEFAETVDQLKDAWALEQNEEYADNDFALTTMGL